MDDLCKLSGVGDYLNAANSPVWRSLSFPGEPGESQTSEQKRFYHYQAAEAACHLNFLKLLRRKISEQVCAHDSFGKSAQPASQRGTKIISTYK